jgi:hypothetical protein
MISGLRWVMNTVVTAAEAEMNDDTALREQLLDAEMRREMGEISNQEFEDLEADILARIREIKERREGGSGPVSMGAQAIETDPDSHFQVEATVSGDFHDPAEAPHTTVVDTQEDRGEQIAVLDMEPGPADRRLTSRRRDADAGTSGTIRTTGTSRKSRASRASRTSRTTRTPAKSRSRS